MSRLRTIAAVLALLASSASAADNLPGQRVKIVTSDSAGQHFLGTSADPLIQAKVDGQKATYSAAAVGIVPAASPTDIFTITGSGTKTVRVLSVQVSGTLTTGAVRDILLIKRSAADSGGTSASVTAVPYDSSDAAATATVLSYTANPSVGAAVGNVRAFKIEFPATNLSSASNPFEMVYGDFSGRAIVLRGTSQVLAVNLNAVTANGGSMDISVEWTEE